MVIAGVFLGIIIDLMVVAALLRPYDAFITILCSYWINRSLSFKFQCLSKLSNSHGYIEIIKTVVIF